MTGIERSNRKQTVVSRLRQYAGKGEYITIGEIQEWWGLGHISTRRKLQGVPHLSGGRYHIEDVAAKVVQMEDENT